MITKKIHQIWFQGKRNIPSHLLSYHESWVDHHPAYEIIVWDRRMIEKLIRNVSKEKDKRWIFTIYHAYPTMIQKIDFAKYVILYYHGGIYLDMDVKCIRSLDELEIIPSSDMIVSTLTENKLHKFLLSFVGHDKTKPVVNNGIIMCAPLHPCMLQTLIECRDSPYLKSIWLNHMMYIYCTTGPLCLTKAVYKTLIDYPEMQIDILPPSYFESCSVDLHCDPHPDAIGLHLYEGSWVKGSDKIFLNMYIYRKIVLWVIIGIMVAVGCYVGYRYYKSKKVVEYELLDQLDQLDQLDPLPEDPDAINEMFPNDLMNKLLEESSIPSTPMSTITDTISESNPLDSIVKQVVHQFKKEMKK